ncbi:ABC transporter substrate-binding protein [Ornithinicoccus hortensis]|uniref:Iron complex transport system substrate-binding protein n=1 Tax=Ornithinicoccus hortensis TaxID=82346 RepID=A0A542YNP9_9MICO|nr:ABC transporter substrate-binding protein [Ornithinicoccus hortensis]TQL49732.1 iron complex transport system substrate-binding protein [Ornithinicoccus hortensis]
MTRLLLTRRTAVATLVAGSLLLTACSSGEDSPEGGSADDGDVSAADEGDDADEGDQDAEAGADDHFPVTIDSALGEAVIEERPERVVTIGWGSSDTAVALGVVPVGIEEVTWGNDEHGNYPWVTEAIEEMGAELPETFTGGQEIDMDAIIGLEPDLILAPLSGITQDDFNILNDLAPTVAYPDTVWNTPWDTQIELIGQALGEPEAAQEAIEGIEQELADRAAEHPEFAGLSFAYVYAGGEPGTLSFYQDGAARVDLIKGLGLELDPTVAEVPLSDGAFTSNVGLENADMLDDVDILFTWYNDEEEQARTEEQRLFAQIPAVERGSQVVSIDRELGMASSFLTPLSVPWALDRFIPEIQTAVEQLD